MIYACECPTQYEDHDGIKVFVHLTRCGQYKPLHMRVKEAAVRRSGLVAVKAYDRS